MVYSATATLHQHSGSRDCFCQQSFFMYNLHNSEKGEWQTSRNSSPALPATILSPDWHSAVIPVILYQHFLCSTDKASPWTQSPACLPRAGGSDLPAQGLTPVPPPGKKHLWHEVHYKTQWPQTKNHQFDSECFSLLCDSLGALW